MSIDPITTCKGTLPNPPLLAFVGSSAAAVRLRALLARAATTSEPVSFRGESGSGKTLAARVLSAQAHPPRTLMRLRCRLVTPDEAIGKLDRISELTNRIEAVDLLLDEVGDAPSWLQERVCSALTSMSGLHPPRILSATARDVERLSDQGALHPDFLELTQGTTIWIPPLRVRRADIREIVGHFLTAFPGVSFDSEAWEWLEAQAWPENVRQLRDVVRRLALLHDHVTRAHIHEEFGVKRPRH